MIRLVLISLLSFVSFTASTARADTVGSYSGCKRTGGNAAACKACLGGGQFYNFDTTRKQWVCGATTGMKRSTSVSKKPAAVSKKPSRPSTGSVKKR